MPRLKVAIGFCVLALLASAPAAFGQETASDGERQIAAPAGPIAVEPTARDSAIAARIERIMNATGWFGEVEVRVDDGVVFLEGVTGRAERRAWAGDLAQRTQDVAAVVNLIAVDRPVEWAFAPALREIRDLGAAFVAALPLIVLGLVVLPLGWFGARLVGVGVRRALRPRVSSSLLLDVVVWLAAAPVFLAGLYVMLRVAGLTGLAVSLLGGAGVLGIVAGFAFRDIGENFLASLLLSVRRPFKAGDYIEVAGQTGFVRSMNTRNTVLLSAEGNHIQIPNAQIFKNIITNYSTAPARRETLRVGIGYDATVVEAQEIVMGVLRGHAAVLEDPEPLVLIHELGSSTVNLEIHYWYDGHAYSQVKVRSALLRLIKKALTEAGISMPDDAREVISRKACRSCRRPKARRRRRPRRRRRARSRRRARRLRQSPKVI